MCEERRQRNRPVERQRERERERQRETCVRRGDRETGR